jgi:hypothetical protein
LIKKYSDLQFLNKEIEALTKRKNTPALAKKQVSCGIFQDIKEISVFEESIVLKTE